MHFKGTAIRSALLALERVAGKDGLERVMAALPLDVREALERPVLAGGTYDGAVPAALHDAIQETLGHGSLVVNHRVGLEAARIDFGGVYRVFIRLMDYDYVLDRIARAWGQYGSRGELTFGDRGPGRAEVGLRDVEGFTPGMWEAIAGRFEGLLLLSGAKNASVKVVEQTPARARLEARWIP